MLFSGAMPLVGLTGGLATGKSTVARLFRECGAVVIDADRLAREVVEPDRPAWREIVRTFGRRILRADRRIDRAALGRLVFGHARHLRRLNAIVHPRVARAQVRRTAAIRRARPRAVIVYDAPVLIEAGAHGRMDALVVVTADQATQITRLRARNGLTRAEALRRIRSQLPLGRKVELADYVIDGCLPIAALRRRVAQIYRDVSRLAGPPPRCPRRPRRRARKK